jgi:hypothetical protein
MKGGLIVLAAGLIFMLLLGFVVGWIVHNIVTKTPVSGTLKIDSSDPDGPYIFLELEENVNAVKRKNCVLLKVDTSSYLSRN